MKISLIQKYLLIGSVFFVGSLFLYYQFLIKPLNSQIISLQNQLSQEEKDLNDAKSIVAKYVEFKKREDSVQRELEWLQDRMPKILDRGKILEAISLTQVKTGVNLIGFQFGSVISGTGSYVEIPATVKLNANFQELLSFLQELEGSDLLMTIHDLSLTSTSDSLNSKITLTAQMTICGVQSK